MIISVNWLQKYLKLNVTTEELTKRIGSRLVEIESVTNLADKYQDALIVKVVTCVPHKNSDHLHVCEIDDGGASKTAERQENGLVQVVCGAPNVRAGMLAVWLPPAAIVPESYGKPDELKLSARKLRGVLSQGMMASPLELDLWSDHDGIMEISGDVQPGTRLADYLDLNDTLLEVENKSLTHRPDCFGVIGFAREVAAIFDSEAKIPAWFNNLDGELKPTKVEVTPTVTITDPHLCSRYECVAFDGVDGTKNLDDVTRSMIGRIGTNSISAPVDITNYMMFDSGQPLHAFDLDKLIAVSPTGKPDIVVRKAHANEKLELLDGREIELDPADIVIAVGNKTNSVAVALAGAMGGMATEITPDTKRVLMESATFDLYHLRGTQFRHGIFSEAITRFTKGQPAGLTRPVLLQTAKLMEKYADAKVISAIASSYPVKTKPAQFNIPVKRFTEVLGRHLKGDKYVDYEASLIEKTLRHLQYNDVKVFDDAIQATAPWWRTDQHIDEDVIEDIGRVNGFDDIEPTSPQRDFTAAPLNGLYEKELHLKQRMREAGGNEAVTYSFVHGDLLDAVGDDKKQAYRIINAISPELQYYRRDLLPGLVKRAKENLQSGYNNFMLFEIGKVHRQGLLDPEEPTLPAEIPELSAVVIDKNKRTDSAFYTVKKILQYAVTVNDLKFTRLDEYAAKNKLDTATNIFEPTRSAVATSGDEYLGVVGEFTLNVRKAFKLPEFVAGFSLHIEPMLPKLSDQPQYTPVMKYQGTSRDVTFDVAPEATFQKVADFVTTTLTHKLKNAIVFKVTPKDIYDIAGRRHITLHIDFSDPRKTIDAKQVNVAMESLARQADKISAQVI